MKMRALWWWIDRWRKSTAFMDMTLEQQAAYRNLLDEAALRGGPLPTDERILAKACGDAMAWERVRAIVMARFTLARDGWRNETLDKVLAASQEIRTTRAESGRRGAGIRWQEHSKCNGKGNGKPIAKDIAKEVAKGVAKPMAPDPDPDPDPDLSPDPIVVHDRARDAPRKAPIIGRNAHLMHVLCDETHSYCVPRAVHQKLGSLLAPKYAGDHDAALDALLAWYPSVWAKLVPEFVMGDAFRFWQGRFDEAFATASPPSSKRMFSEPTQADAEAQLEMLRKADAQRERDRLA